MLLKDNFTLSTWLLIGAACQSLLLLFPIRPSYALAPVFVLMGYRIIRTGLMCFGLVRNPHMDGVLEGKYAAIYPSSASQGEERKKRERRRSLHYHAKCTV